MPNKYEREIEEILRNLDRPEPKPGLGSRIRAFNRPRPKRARRAWEFGLSASEMFLLAGILVILLAAGLAFFWYGRQPTFLFDTPLVGWISLLGFALFVVGLVVGWRYGGSSGRASSIVRRSTTYTSSTTSTPADVNVVRLNSHRGHNPFSAVATQFRILRLKMRYQRLRDHENDVE